MCQQYLQNCKGISSFTIYKTMNVDRKKNACHIFKKNIVIFIIKRQNDLKALKKSENSIAYLNIYDSNAWIFSSRI